MKPPARMLKRSWQILSINAGERNSPEKINFLGKYKTPANCTDLMTARIAKEIWVQLNAFQKKADLQVANIQQNLQKIAVSTVHTANDSLEAKWVKRSIITN